MLFNSLIFILGFLPVAVGGYYALAALRLEMLRLPFIILISLFFYGYWTPQYTILLTISTVLNYAFGRWIGDAAAKGQYRIRSLLVTSGVVLNLLALGYYKYANFFLNNLNSLVDTGLTLDRIILPLAISFYTFQQIAYLVDVGRGTVKSGGFLSYVAFVIFFPQLIAGPIVHFQELVPQLIKKPRLDRALQNILIGLIIFAIGLTKKTVFADSAALFASPVFDMARDGTTPGLAAAWGAAFAYTLQVYFDFSGYSDMAIGLARMFGMKLPLNFHSPLRAGSISGLWQQWHMTLGRFVRSYVLQPLAAPLARWSANKGHDRKTGHRYSVMLPMFISMVVIGVWHGAGWNFVLFGALHGLYMVINEAWNFRKRQRKAKPLPAWMTTLMDRGGGHVLTVLAFVVAAIPFRAATEAATARMYGGMIGVGGDTSSLGDLWPMGLAGLGATVFIGYLIVFLMPNTQQIMKVVDPALDWARWSEITPPVVKICWRPTVFWTIIGGAILCLGIAFILRGSTEFIYFNF
ncbi:MAG: hypothetical protein OEY05_11410 [Paracoccaceae bacterium]|nr:hypothetical protein [Paracoccaceae bacterium]